MTRLDIAEQKREAFREHMGTKAIALHGTMSHALEAFRTDPRTVRWNDFIRTNRQNVRLSLGYSADNDGGLYQETSR